MPRSLTRRASAVGLCAVLGTGLAVAMPTDAGAAKAGISAVALTPKAGYVSYPNLRYGSRGAYVKNLQWKLRIKINGVFGKETYTTVRWFQRIKGLPVTGVVTTSTWVRLKPPPKPRPALRSGIRASTTKLNWRALAKCESGGRRTAVNSAGYYGLYQFNVGTWRGVGGSGYPHRASSAEQTYRAQLLFQRRGAQPWPHCGPRLYA